MLLYYLLLLSFFVVYLATDHLATATNVLDKKVPHCSLPFARGTTQDEGNSSPLPFLPSSFFSFLPLSSSFPSLCPTTFCYPTILQISFLLSALSLLPKGSKTFRKLLDLPNGSIWGAASPLSLNLNFKSEL